MDSTPFMRRTKMKTTMDDAFEKVKAVCVDLTKNCSLDRLQRLNSVCHDLDDQSLQFLQEYLLFPLRISLRTQTNQIIAIESINFISRILRRTVVRSWNLFQDIMSQLFHFISGPQYCDQKSSSEELKYSICDCVRNLILNATTDILKKFYGYDYRMPLAQYIFTLIEILKNEISKPLRLAALDALSSLLYVNKNFDKSTDISVWAGERLSTFLPGVAIIFVDILTGDVKQGHLIFVSSLEIFSDFLLLVVGDKFVNQDGLLSDKVDKDEKKLRSSKWIEDIADKLKLVINRICEVVTHEHWEVRHELAKFAEKLLCHCKQNMTYNISPLLQTLFILSVDDYDQVVIASKAAIKKFSENAISFKNVNSILEEDILTISSKLVKIHLSTNDNQKLSLLKTLRGYFELLGDSMNILLYSLPHLDRFLLSLLSLIKFDYSNQNFMVEHMPSLNFNSSFSKLWHKKRFKYFDDHQIATQISSICFLLGHHGDINLLSDTLLEKLDTPYRNESVLLMNGIVKGLRPETFENDLLFKEKHHKVSDYDLSKNVIGMIVESFISMSIWKYSLDSDFEKSSELPLNRKENILQLCLMLECLATCSEVIGRDFRIHLMQVLCPVLEKAGSSNLMISQSGRLALFCIAKSCAYNSVTNLIMDNADYIVNNITINLNHFLSQPETVIILRVIVDNSDANILPLIKDPILKMLQTLDCNQEKSLLVMSVVKSIIVAIGRWFRSKILASQPVKKSQTRLRSAILERHALKKIEMSFLEDNSDISTDPLPDEDRIEESPKSSLHGEIITEVLARCIHMLSSSRIDLVVLTLEVIDASLIAMKDDNDKVLPYVHKIWSPLICRFTGNVLIMMKAFETLIIIANECGDFIKSRTMKDVWPKLLAFLKSQATCSVMKSSESDYCVTTAFKLQLLLLLEIGNFAAKLELTEKEFESAVWHCFTYLEANQPAVLQEAAKKSLSCFAVIDPDAMWFHYNERFGCKYTLLPPSDHFKTVNFVPFTHVHLHSY